MAGHFHQTWLVILAAVHAEVAGRLTNCEHTQGVFRHLQERDSRKRSGESIVLLPRKCNCGLGVVPQSFFFMLCQKSSAEEKIP